MDQETKKILLKIAGAVRQLAMDATQKADSGHPGLPMGCAELGAYLYGVALRHNPKNPDWLNRDRFVLSAGHGSLLLYSLLYMSGFGLSIEDIKKFRQLNSLTPGHPEYGHVKGIEATTGPLGQGTGNAVGMALGLKMMNEKFSTPEFQLFDAKVFCLASDGDMMEGVSHEVSSLAGHLKLNNLIFLYDSNHVSLDGPLPESCSEDTLARYKAYGWDTFEVDGYDLDQIHSVISGLKNQQTKPAFILVHTIIGKGAPTKAGTSKAHGSPLGISEVKAAKEALGLSEEEFFVPQPVKTFFSQKLQKDKTIEEDWEEKFRKWSKANPKLFDQFQKMKNKEIPDGLEQKLKKIEIKNPSATRESSHEVLTTLGDLLPFFIGGSADLATSDKTMMKQFPLISPGHFQGRNIKFGVREFGMATIASGLYLAGLFVPFVGTFLTFSDYMRNAIRLAALSHYKVVYQFSHDSIFLGEDGPTHQPIEQFASLRAIPNLYVIRPADANEVKMAWVAALAYSGPTAILVSRQPLKTLEETNVSFQEGVGKGAYIVKKEKEGGLDFTFFATGSELQLALASAEELEKRGKNVRVVSMPCWELFEKQDSAYKKEILEGDLGKRVSIEAGVEQGWHKYIGREGIAISMETFGASAPADAIAHHFGFTVDAVLETIL